MRERLAYRAYVEFFVLELTAKKEALKSMKQFKVLRKKLEEAAFVVRNEAFDDWIMRYVDEAERPDEWTQARDLYDCYLKRAKDYGNNRADKAISKQELATFTMWGKMMGGLFSKKRRSNGQFYPLRLKKGA